ncbi:MAG TPA: RNA polymerase factor sigma-54, partial [Gammaproteobacteria bacterium]
MKQTLQLRLGQQLTMTPQLQQAIKLLQLASVELQTEIQQALDSNPMLEVDDDSDGVPLEDSPENANGDLSSPTVDVAEQSISNDNSSGITETEPFDSQWEMDSDWDSYTPAAKNHDGIPDREIYERQDFNQTSLREYLLWQLRLSQMSDSDRAI